VIPFGSRGTEKGRRAMHYWEGFREFRLSSQAISDHLSRLYGDAEGDTEIHVDGAASGRIRIVKETKHRATFLADSAAINEFLDDMDYQVEVSVDDLDARRYGAICKRAYDSIAKQLAKEVK